MSGKRFTGTIFTWDVPVPTQIQPSEIDSTQTLLVTAYPLNPTLDLRLHLEGISPGLPIVQDTGWGGTFEQITYTQVQPGTTYTAKIDGFMASDTGPFLLEVSSERPNDFSFAPETRGILTGHQDITGFVGRSDPNDWYQFVLGSNSEVHLTLSGLQDNAEIELYQQNTMGVPTLLRSGTTAGTANESIVQPLAAGTYLAHVFPNATSANLVDSGQASTPYTLAIEPVTRLAVTITSPTLTPGSCTTPSDPGAFIRFHKGEPAITPGGVPVISNYNIYALSQGNDSFYLGNVPDPIVANPISDPIQQANACWVVCLGGDDAISGTFAIDPPINANSGADLLNLGDGADLALGGRDSDRLYGEGGNDILAGNEHNDLLDGGDGDDTLLGGQGDDILMGGSGADWLSGELGQDVLIGSTGGDTFVLKSEPQMLSATLPGADIISDFNIGEGDRIGLTGGTMFANLALTAIDLTLDGATQVSTAIQLGAMGPYMGIVRGITPDLLNASMFAGVTI